MKKLEIFSKSKANAKEDSKIRTVPFYGVKGSICKIEEKEHQYITTRYGVNGEEGEILITPKRKKGKELEKNYIEDMKKYLEKDWERYLTSLNQQPKKIISKKKTIIASVIAATVATATGIGIMLTSEIMMTIYLPIFITSFIITCSEIKQLKRITKEEKEKKFRKQYESLTKKVNDYNRRTAKAHGSITKYSNIKQNTKNKTIGDKRILKKVA